MTLTRYMYREARRRPGRTLLTLLGIVIGVQALVAIPLSIETTRTAHRGLFEGLTGKAALEVIPRGQGGFDPGLAAKLEAVEGVASAVPLVQAPAAILGPAGFVPVVTLGLDIKNDSARDYSLVSGSFLTDDGQMLLEESFAQTLGIELGATVPTADPVRYSRVAGRRVAGAARGGVRQRWRRGHFDAEGVAKTPRARRRSQQHKPGS